MQFVLDELVDLIKKGVSTVKDDNVLTNFPSFPDISEIQNFNSSLPSILVHDEGFVFEPDNLGISYGEAREETSQQISCDGKSSDFLLADAPVNSIISVEVPLGNKLSEHEDFLLDYKSGVLKFRTPPSKGKDNLLVHYLGARKVGESKGIRLSVKCFIDCFAKSSYECDNVVLEVIRAMLLSNEDLSYRGFNIRALQSMKIHNNGAESLTATEDKKGDGSEVDAAMKSRRKSSSRSSRKEPTNAALFGRRLVYQIDTNVEIDTRIETIKGIRLTFKKPV